jgi:hypothetical protein
MSCTRSDSRISTILDAFPSTRRLCPTISGNIDDLRALARLAIPPRRRTPSRQSCRTCSDITGGSSRPIFNLLASLALLQQFTHSKFSTFRLQCTSQPSSSYSSLSLPPTTLAAAGVTASNARTKARFHVVRSHHLSHSRKANILRRLGRARPLLRRRHLQEGMRGVSYEDALRKDTAMYV